MRFLGAWRLCLTVEQGEQCGVRVPGNCACPGSEEDMRCLRAPGDHACPGSRGSNALFVCLATMLVRGAGK